MTMLRISKERMKAIHDKMILRKEFVLGESVLLYNSRLHLFPGKLRIRWTGPYIVRKVFPHGAILLLNPRDGSEFKVNGHRLKKFIENQPLEETTWDVQDPPLGGN